MRILIVEDDKQIGQYLKQGLKESGYVSDQVMDAEEGFCAARSINYDLFIVDLMSSVKCNDPGVVMISAPHESDIS